MKESSSSTSWDDDDDDDDCSRHYWWGAPGRPQDLTNLLQHCTEHLQHLPVPCRESRWRQDTTVRRARSARHSTRRSAAPSTRTSAAPCTTRSARPSTSRSAAPCTRRSASHPMNLSVPRSTMTSVTQNTTNSARQSTTQVTSSAIKYLQHLSMLWFMTILTYFSQYFDGINCHCHGTWILIHS